MRSNSGTAGKRSGKVTDGQPALAGNMLQRELSLQIGVDRIPREPQLPRRQSSSHRRSRKTHAAIYARKMNIQGGRDPINKLAVCAVVLFDRRYQTVAEVQDNRITGGNAGLQGKLDDPIDAVIVSKLIERGSRNQKVKA